ncbi:MAG TPA: dihydroorotate dehydrogenase electron transfer subunit [Phycisphaerales bacterium]|nr:dihydroorotate dehydrogenase electron transfer subunit [Phycisphaerales bacterium]
MEKEVGAGHKGSFTAKVLSNQQIRECYYRLNLKLDPIGSRLFETAKPGRFVEIDLAGLPLPPEDKIPPALRDAAYRQILLRRPFSFSDVIFVPGQNGPCVKLEILYCILGPATLRMMTLAGGDTLNLIGPLGNGFALPDTLKKAVLIAGGMGAPPLLHLGGYLKRHRPEVETICFAGAKSCEDLPFTLKIGNLTGLVLEEFDVLGIPSLVATDDGSAGFRGFVTDCARRWLRDNQPNPGETLVYACGPEPMLAEAARLAKEFDLPCQVSMERMMACGIGLCQSCAVEIKTDSPGQTEYKLCCKDGPVFDSRNVIFNL